MIESHLGWDSLALLQGSFGPFRPKVAKRVRNEFPEPLGPRGPKKSKTESNESKSQREKNWEHSSQEGIRKYLFFPNAGHLPWKSAKFSLNFWPVRLHEKPSFRHVLSTFFAQNRQYFNYFDSILPLFWTRCLRNSFRTLNRDLRQYSCYTPL